MTTLNEQIARLMFPYEIIRMGNKVGYEASYNELGKELTQNVDPDAVFDFVELPNYSEDINAAWKLMDGIEPKEVVWFEDEKHWQCVLGTPEYGLVPFVAGIGAHENAATAIVLAYLNYMGVEMGAENGE